jgi:hypothetical protein
MMAFIGRSVLHGAESSIGHHAADSKEGESAVSEMWASVQKAGFPFFGLPHFILYLALVLVVLAFLAYSVAGKGGGSHAGREEPRRAYRRELARQMARDDAKKIIAGEDPSATKKRRKWMQW